LKNKWVNVIFDPFITRWLDYYTWTVFETFISDYFDFWSICSWGKYDNLVEDIRKVSGSKWENYTWVWGSIGLTRLFSRLDDSGLLNKRLPLTDTIIFNIPWNDIEYKEIVWDILRQSDISTDIYYGDDKLWKQFAYAESKNIPFWIFAWWEEKQNNAVVVKNLDTRESEQVEISSLVAYIKEKLNKIVE
jgi:histidyl-tRNA synthetase